MAELFCDSLALKQHWKFTGGKQLPVPARMPSAIHEPEVTHAVASCQHEETAPVVPDVSPDPSSCAASTDTVSNSASALVVRAEDLPGRLSAFACLGFHGTISYDQTLQRLHGKPPGAYLVRLSRTQRGNVVLAYVDFDGAVQQVIITPHCSGGKTVTCSGYVFRGGLRRLLDVYSRSPSSDAATSPADTSETTAQSQAVLQRAVAPSSDRITIIAAIDRHRTITLFAQATT